MKASEVRNPQRKLVPDTVGLVKYKQTSLREIAEKARACKQTVCIRLALRGGEYNRGTGCGKTIRQGLCGGCRVTGIPTAECPGKKADEPGV